MYLSKLRAVITSLSKLDIIIVVAWRYRYEEVAIVIDGQNSCVTIRITWAIYVNRPYELLCHRVKYQTQVVLW